MGERMIAEAAILVREEQIFKRYDTVLIKMERNNKLGWIAPNA